jgi:hypothetical protein
MGAWHRLQTSSICGFWDGVAAISAETAAFQYGSTAAFAIIEPDQRSNGATFRFLPSRIAEAAFEYE